MGGVAKSGLTAKNTAMFFPKQCFLKNTFLKTRDAQYLFSDTDYYIGNY
jgi:hypothetical protein